MSICPANVPPTGAAPDWTILDWSGGGTNLGRRTVIMDGLHLWSPTGATISAARLGHTLRLAQTDGSIANLHPAPGYESADAALTAWVTLFAHTPDERTLPLRYFPATTLRTPGLGFTLLDDSTGDERAYGADAEQIDAVRWYPPARPLALILDGSRWDDQLWLQQANGDSFPLAKGQLRDTAVDGGTGWFDATASFHPELAWWIYDATTREFSPVNPPDMANWYTYFENNSLPEAWQLYYFGQTGINPWADWDGDGVGNLTEYLQGRNPTVGAMVGTAATVALETFTPLR